jgi:NADPH:quinone reductase-like Zn-dependent oxidoreductase
MQAITVRDRGAGVGGLSLTDMPYPHAGQNDVVVRVHAAGFTPGELDWPTTWTDRTPSVPGHELSGVVDQLGYATTGLTVGQRVRRASRALKRPDWAAPAWAQMSSGPALATTAGLVLHSSGCEST